MRLPRKVALFSVLFLGLFLLLLAGNRWAGLLPPVDVLQPVKEKIQWPPAPGKEAKPLPLQQEDQVLRAEQEKKPAKTEGGEASAEATGTHDETVNAPADVPPPLRQEIEARYIARLEAICSYYEEKLNTLVGSAWNEYSTARTQGQKISAVYLAGKYLAAGNALEKECDREFYAVLADFRSELRKHSLPLDKTYEAQREYERAKTARKRQILSAAAKFF